MQPDFKTILYVTDLSDNAAFAFKYAVSLARRFGAIIDVLHVAEDPAPFAKQLAKEMMGEDRWKALFEQRSGALVSELHRRVLDFCTLADGHARDCIPMVREVTIAFGNPARVIVDTAESGGYDVVVMGSRGQGAFAESMLGSTAQKVLRRCNAPVLVIRLPKTAE